MKRVEEKYCISLVLLVVALVLQESHDALASITLHTAPVRTNRTGRFTVRPRTFGRFGLLTTSSSDSSSGASSA